MIIPLDTVPLCGCLWRPLFSLDCGDDSIVSCIVWCFQGLNPRGRYQFGIRCVDRRQVADDWLRWDRFDYGLIILQRQSVQCGFFFEEQTHTGNIVRVGNEFGKLVHHGARNSRWSQITRGWLIKSTHDNELGGRGGNGHRREESSTTKSKQPPLSTRYHRW